MTLCIDCDHYHPENEKRPIYKQMCMKFPRICSHNFVIGDKVRISDPYMYCENINGGKCPLWTPRKGPQIDLGV